MPEVASPDEQTLTLGEGEGPGPSVETFWGWSLENCARVGSWIGSQRVEAEALPLNC